jgi:cytochrome c2
MIHTGDISHAAKANEFDDAQQMIGRAKLDVHYAPSEHDILDPKTRDVYLERFGKGATGGGRYSFDQGGVHFVSLNNVVDLKKNGLGSLGPRHRGVVGRKAASLPDYDYSDALKSANIVWNEEALDKWLTDPQAVAPGAKMFFHLDNPQDRADVIAYLRERAK